MEAFFILTKIRIQNVTYITSKLPNFKTSKYYKLYLNKV